MGDILLVKRDPGRDRDGGGRPGAGPARRQEVWRHGRQGDEPHQLVQVVVAPHSPFIGETIGSVDFRTSFDVLVVGLWRRQEWIRDKLSQVRMREGDLLVLRGTPGASPSWPRITAS